MRFSVGMYGGSFNPLHLGHVDCILQAANMCEMLFIVLSVGRNRQEIDVLVRYRWLYQLTKHIGNVKIIILEDDAPDKSSYNKSCWAADANKVKEQIGQPIDVVFCGSDYGLGSFWDVCYPESRLHIFPRNEISSTEIRQNVYAHWDWLPSVVRPYYVQKVLLIGGESTGKSTLSINLAHRFNTNFIEEAGRDISQRSGTDLKMLDSDFTEILLRHKLSEIEAVQQSNKVLFVDTDALVTLFYLNFLKSDRPGKVWSGNVGLAKALDRLNDYDLILFLEPDVAFVQDGDRSLVIEADREKFSEQIKDLLRTSGRPWVTLSGDYQTRYELAVAEVEKLLQ